MKVWRYEHVFHFPWEIMAQAHWLKHPNPEQPAVLGSDVLERGVDTDGFLHSYRLIQSDWGLPQWAQAIIGQSNRVCLAHERSIVKPEEQLLQIHSCNTTFANVLQIREKLTYHRHEAQPEGMTKLYQEVEVTVSNVPFTSFLEGFVISNVAENAAKGRAAITQTANCVLNETKSDLRTKMHSLRQCLESMHSQQASVQKSLSLLQEMMRNIH